MENKLEQMASNAQSEHQVKLFRFKKLLNREMKNVKQLKQLKKEVNTK